MLAPVRVPNWLSQSARDERPCKGFASSESNASAIDTMRRAAQYGGPMNKVLLFVVGAVFGALAVAYVLIDAEDESDLQAGLQCLSEDDRDEVIAAMRLEKARQLSAV